MKYWSKALIRSLVGRIIFFMSKVFTLSNILFWLYNCIKLSHKKDHHDSKIFIFTKKIFTRPRHRDILNRLGGIGLR